MRKEIKKVCKRIALAAAAFCAVITLGKSDVKAQDIQMGNLEIGQTKTVTLQSSTGRDNFYFHFATPKNASFKISVALIERRNKKTNEIADGGYTHVKATIDYKDIWSTYTWHNDGTYTSPEFAYAPGKDCTIRIDNVDDWYKYTYQITVDKVAYSNFEKENNNFPTAATTLKNKQTANGILNDGDTDWYVFKAPKTGKYKFSVVNSNIEDGGYFHCEAYKNKNKVDYGKGAYIWQGHGWYKINTLKLKKGKKYYIKISSGSREGIHYQIKVKKVK